MYQYPKLCLSIHLVILFITTGSAYAQDETKLQGDVGMGLYRTPAITETRDESNAMLPYLYASYGQLYARVNTVGYKLTPLGAGHLEVAGRIGSEGYKSSLAGVTDRSNPFPVGVGTFQKTPIGAFFVYGFHDATSGGSLLDMVYTAKLTVGGLSIYPQIGVERRSEAYVQHLYGVSASEAAANGSIRTYQASASTVPNAGVTFLYPLEQRYNLTFQLRKKWLDSSITDSPLVNTKSQITSFVAVTRSFD